MAIRIMAFKIGCLCKRTPSAISAMKARANLRMPRYFSDDKGRILSEEERAKETVYIKKMERERSEKLRKKKEKEKAETEQAAGGGINKGTQELHKG